MPKARSRKINRVRKLQLDKLPVELRALVRTMTDYLGIVISEYEGEDFYNRIESYRQMMKKDRASTDSLQLHKISAMISEETPSNQYKIAHAFALLLEIINACESAYRTWRQQHKPSVTENHFTLDLNFVLTAHPTEARSENVVKILHDLISLMVQGFQKNSRWDEKAILSQIRMLWITPLVKTHPPTVVDEAHYIYSIIFSDSLLDFLLEEKPQYELKLRTWVGGDKDGHPGVNENIMVASLTGSRKYLVGKLMQLLQDISQDLDILGLEDQKSNQESQIISELAVSLVPLLEVRDEDGKRLHSWLNRYQTFTQSASRFVKNHHQVAKIERLFKLFPALVLPLELREDSEEIAKAVVNPQAPIAKMLIRLKRITEGFDMIAYSRGFIISHCESEEDISTANQLAWKTTGSRKIPVIPLFESREALINGPKILKSWLKSERNLKQVQKDWLGKLEVMLGYSDSAKQIGVLPSRTLIRKAMNELQTTITEMGLTPVFFHGSGGSVDRGGGSLREQISWWSDGAIGRPKLTVQGEMIQRTFATQEILHSQCVHVSSEASLRKNKKAKIPSSRIFEKFVSLVQDRYTNFVSHPELLDSALEATPYHYLNVLRIGSRPTKRPAQMASITALRAIPWVLCWTQTRLLLPTWWGIGSAWQQLAKNEKEELRKLYRHDPFFSSFVKTLGFTLAKVEIKIWNQYLHARYGEAAKIKVKKYREELNQSCEFMKYITETSHLIPHKLWLEESITLRSPYVHVLNLLQIKAMEDQNEKLLKETLVGIACGMLTTG